MPVPPRHGAAAARPRKAAQGAETGRSLSPPLRSGPGCRLGLRLLGRLLRDTQGGLGLRQLPPQPRHLLEETTQGPTQSFPKPAPRPVDRKHPWLSDPGCRSLPCCFVPAAIVEATPVTEFDPYRSTAVGAPAISIFAVVLMSLLSTSDGAVGTSCESARMTLKRV